MASIKAKIQKAVNRLGVQISYIETIPTSESPLPCPCMQNPWKKYDPAWHTANPDQPNCNGTGQIVGQVDTPADWISLDKAIVIPNYQAKGSDMEWLLSGKYPDWSWLCVTSDYYKMLRVKLKDSQFKVVATLPYYVEGNTTDTTATIYLLQPITTGGIS
jgi:hypothetical protein